MALGACAHRAPLFQVEQNRRVHSASGVGIPLVFPQWQEIADSVQENISPEITTAISFQYVSDRLGWKPSASIFICREKTTSNLKVVENRSVINLQSVKFLKTESLRLKNRKRIILSSYNHQIPWSAASSSGSKTLKTIKSLSLFATTEKDSKSVVWVMLERDSKFQRNVAMDFIERALFTAGAEPVSAAPSVKEKKTKKRKK
jgi:hypothetical protein